MRPIKIPYINDLPIFQLLAICAGIAALTLAGCSGKTYPFAKNPKAASRTAALAPPPLYLAALQGTPRNVSVKLANLLAREARLRNMTFAARETRKTVRITGRFSTSQTKQGAAITYVWNMTDYKSGKRHRITGKNLVSGHRQAAAWLGADDAMLKQIARKTVENISSWYTRSGYSIQQTALPPPELAPWATRRSVTTIPVPDVPAKTARLKSRKPVTIDPRAQPVTAQTAMPVLHTASVGKRHKPSPKTSSRQTTVAIRPISGLNADANNIFLETLQTHLGKAGFIVTELPEQNIPSITGKVSLGRTQSGRQHVSLTWQVYDTKGIRIGTVIQKNRIPSRSFSGTWAGNARLAANAATPGLVKLLNQAR